MEMRNIRYEYQYRPNKERAFMVLHGVSEGIESDFIQNITEALSRRSETVLALNFPYIDRGEKPSEGLNHEQSSVQVMMNFLENEGYRDIHIVGKSLGGIVASEWLAHHKSDARITTHILSYVIGDVRTRALKGSLQTVIQGENDRYGNAAAVRAELAAHDISATVIEVPGADHSYRDADGQPTLQAEAIDYLMQQP